MNAAAVLIGAQRFPQDDWEILTCLDYWAGACYPEVDFAFAEFAILASKFQGA